MNARVKSLTALIAVAALLLTLPVAYAQTLTITLDKTTYIPGDTVYVSGTAPANQYVSISVVNPNGKEVDFKVVVSDSQGKYSTTIKLPSTLPYGDWVAGTYTVTAYLGATTASTTFVLSPGARVTGKVVDTKGNPIEGAEVKIVETGDKATTAADGTFTLYTTPGTYTLSVSKPGYVSVQTSVTLTTGDNKVGTITLTSLEELVKALETKVASLEQTVLKLQSDLTTLQQNIMSKLTEISDGVGGLSKKVDTLTTTVNTIKANLDDALSSLKTISTDISTVKSDVAGIKASLAALSDTVGKLTPTIEQLRTDITGLKTDVASVKTDVTSVKNVVSGLEGSIKSAIDASKAEVGGKVDTVSGKVDTLSIAVYVALIFALLSFITSLIVFLSVRKAVTAK